MSMRVTIVLDDDLAKKLRDRQSSQIKKTTSAVSFSKVVNDVLFEGLKKE